MKISCVALSASVFALTASAAIVPYQASPTKSVRSTLKDRHDGDYRAYKAPTAQISPMLKLRKKETRRSRVRSTVYVDSDRQYHGNDVVTESSTEHGHRHPDELVDAAGFRHDPTMIVERSGVPSRVNVHQHVHYRRKNQHGSPKASPPRRFFIKHGKPRTPSAKKGIEDHRNFSHSSSESRHKSNGNDKSIVAAKKPRRPKYLFKRSMPADPPVTQSGVPGFVEVATHVFKSSLAKTVSGLAYSTNNTPNGTSFDLGTSDDQSTQFFMSPVSGSNGSVVYQLRVPILDSDSFTTVDHCATFAISPPGPLSLQNCGPIPGCSQLFSYDSASGQLQPIYGLSQMLPVGSPIPTVLNSTHSSQAGRPGLGNLRQTKMVTSANGSDALMSNSSSFSNGTDSSMVNSTTLSNDTTSHNSTSDRNSTAPLAPGNMTFSNGNSSSIVNDSSVAKNGRDYPHSANGSERFMEMRETALNKTNSSSTSSSPSQASDLPSNNTNSTAANSPPSQGGEPSPSSVSLYFVPAEGFYQKPATIDQMLNSTSDLDPASSAGNLRNVAASDGGNGVSDANVSRSQSSNNSTSHPAGDFDSTTSRNSTGDVRNDDGDPQYLQAQDAPQSGNTSNAATMTPGSE